jgi:hypothetical protein
VAALRRPIRQTSSEIGGAPGTPSERLVVDQICHAVLDGMSWVALQEQADIGDVFHFGGSAKLKEGFLKAGNLAPQVDLAPIVVVVDEGSWGFLFVRLLARVYRALAGFFRARGRDAMATVRLCPPR